VFESEAACLSKFMFFSIGDAFLITALNSLKFDVSPGCGSYIAYSAGVSSSSVPSL